MFTVHRPRVAAAIASGLLAATLVAAAPGGAATDTSVYVAERISIGESYGYGLYEQPGVRPRALPDGRVLVAVSEEGEAADLNGDGDRADRVLHVVDDHGVTTSLGLDVAAFDVVGDGAVLASGDGAFWYWPDPNLAPVRIADAGMFHDLTTGASAAWVTLPDGSLALAGAAGTTVDEMGAILVLDTTTGLTIDTGVRSIALPQALGEVGFYVVALHDRDGDGDLDGFVPTRWDPDAGAVTYEQAAASDEGGGVVHDRWAVVAGVESAAGDLNGDGDTEDDLLVLLDLVNGEVTSTGLTPPQRVDHSAVAYGDEHALVVAAAADGVNEVYAVELATGVAQRQGLEIVRELEPFEPRFLEFRGRVLVEARTSEPGDVTSRIRVLDPAGGHMADGAVGAITTLNVAGGFRPRFTAVLGNRLLMARSYDLAMVDPVAGTVSSVSPPDGLRMRGPNSIAVVGEELVWSASLTWQLSYGSELPAPSVLRTQSDGSTTLVNVATGRYPVVTDAGHGRAAVLDDINYGGNATGLHGALQLVTLAATPDVGAPLLGSLEVSPGSTSGGSVLRLTAPVSDPEGSRIVLGVSSVNGVDHDAAVYVTTDQIDLLVDTQPGPNEICLHARDGAGNAAIPVCRTVIIDEPAGPTVRDLVLDAPTTGIGDTVGVQVVVDDTEGGDDFIIAGEVRLDGAVTAMSPVDGAFDEPVEDLAASVILPDRPGTYELCVHATDGSGLWSPSPACTLIDVVDDLGPSVALSGRYRVVRTEVFPGQVRVDDTATGGGVITRARITIDGESIDATTPADGAYDEAMEPVTIRVPGEVTAALALGGHDMCLTATDDAGNDATSCATLEVLPQRALGDVVLAEAPERVSATFDVELLDDGPAGELTHVDGDSRFVATSFTSFEVLDAGTTARITGTGTLDGLVPCSFEVRLTEGYAADPWLGEPYYDFDLACLPLGILGSGAEGTPIEGVIWINE